jgi:hypothetical protein
MNTLAACALGLGIVACSVSPVDWSADPSTPKPKSVVTTQTELPEGGPSPDADEAGAPPSLDASPPLPPPSPPSIVKPCCGKHGLCVPKLVVPETAGNMLDDDGCTEGEELCVPEQLLSPTTKPSPCTATLPFVMGSYTGVCVSDCFDEFVPRGNCPGDLVCAPNP